MEDRVTVARKTSAAARENHVLVYDGRPLTAQHAERDDERVLPEGHRVVQGNNFILSLMPEYEEQRH